MMQQDIVPLAVAMDLASLPARQSDRDARQ
jgi:hypothetical protein